eukprot:tig00000459_g1162.t2
MASRTKGIATLREATPSQPQSSRRTGRGGAATQSSRRTGSASAASGRRYSQAEVDALVAVGREQGREEVLVRSFVFPAAFSCVC